MKEAQRTEQLLCTYQATAHLLRYVLEPAGEDAAIARCYAEGKGLALDFMRAHAAGGAPAGAGEATRAV